MRLNHRSPAFILLPAHSAITSVLLALSLPVLADGTQWHFEFSEGSPVKFVWQTESNTSYDLWYSEDLKDWTHVDGFPKTARGAEMDCPLTPGLQGFFKITSGPVPPDGFALIPAGSFEMGDQADSLSWGAMELPVHTVQV